MAAAVSDFKSFIEREQTRDHSAAAAIWQQKLSGFTAPTALPVDLVADVNAVDAGYG